MSLDKVLAQVQNQVPDCVAVGFIDMTTGRLVGGRGLEGDGHDLLASVATASSELFASDSVHAVERMFERTRVGRAGNERSFQEFLVLSKNLLHVFLRGRVNAQHVLVFVCRATANVGMALSKARLSQGVVEAAL